MEFLDQKAYLKVKNEKFYNPLDYIIHEIDQKAQTISWEFSGEGTINVFHIKSQDSLEFKQEGAENSYVFSRSKVKYSD